MGWRDQAAAMGLPLWVKPARLGSSVGISQGDRAPSSELDAGGRAGAARTTRG